MATEKSKITIIDQTDLDKLSVLVHGTTFDNFEKIVKSKHILTAEGTKIKIGSIATDLNKEHFYKEYSNAMKEKKLVLYV